MTPDYSEIRVVPDDARSSWERSSGRWVKDYRNADGKLKEGFILPSWQPVCATLDYDWCTGMDWEEPIYPSDLGDRTPSQTLRENYGWRKTKKYGWLCPGCQALLDGKPNPREGEVEDE